MKTSQKVVSPGTITVTDGNVDIQGWHFSFQVDPDRCAYRQYAEAAFEWVVENYDPETMILGNGIFRMK